MNLSDIIKRYQGEYEQRFASTITQAQRHAMNAILQCRSGRYGQMALDCTQCDFQSSLNHSCGHRFCHQCQHHDTHQWLDRQAAKLLPTNYFLVTFTLPQQLRSLTYNHQKMIYPILFDSAVSTLKTFMANDKELHAEAGMTAVLHTHSRRLNYHPHIHVVIPAGGINRKLNGWASSDRSYLFKQTHLASVFRARVLEAFRNIGVITPPDTPRKWIADCQFAGRGLPALKYLSRYLYRGVINEKNIVADNGTHVTFKYIDSSTKQWRTRTLPGAQFLRLLFRHVLPKGLRRVRDYGFLHGNAKLKLLRIQLILKVRLSPIKPKHRPSVLCAKCQSPMNISAFIRPAFSSA